MVKSENSSWLKDSTRAGLGIVSLAGCVGRSCCCHFHSAARIKNRASTVPRTYNATPIKAIFN